MMAAWMTKVIMVMTSAQDLDAVQEKKLPGLKLLFLERPAYKAWWASGNLDLGGSPPFPVLI